jgi:uracil-DNA glycosylase
MILMKKTIFIGQAMPKLKRHPHDWPSLNQWLYSIRLTDELISKNFLYSALIDYFPGAMNGSHVVPTKEEIDEERDRLINTITSFNPEIVVPIGRLSISYCLDERVKPLVDNVGQIYITDPYLATEKELTVIPLPHPSGASTWGHKKENKILLKKALKLLKNELI